METLHIHAEKLTTKHYIGLFVSIITVTLAFVSYFNSQLSAISVCIMVVLVAVVLLLMIKVINTPCISFTLTFMHCQYHSRYGGWTTTWHNIAHIGHATLGSQGWHSSLPWIGIRLKNYDDFIRNICPRVASRILLEQRILLIMALKSNPDSPHQLEDMLFDDSPFTTQNGEQIRGLQAMLANRMRYNRALLGFDFFIADDVIDRPIADFIGLLRRYKAAA
ncbi:DUF2982 domain-containing protein [Photobacterium phosphoreum]|mgnify:CR=1 FL=1|uniref:DUF2982 domain-containing protein n=1 Tax=Photobacterium phosphoreum TaxID=659 RepID=UPI0007F8EDD7|nr:DUF2982 domain-containing protein [Photobacterium phosphoreum]MCD9501002.1 DUF2982 domain-containing protein [Photobacterium phosphoreum]MCD9505184.1 DUF2982 domain-containing protein [Photobacterium phosphoreum]MCD9517209.1 DUF2982 domain-containing protein [Photobacterium phosphoreum]OBU35713.1 hypothetical protein AYY24_03960 [Photobacterium phosphoreum]PSU60466.1 DUF2982 domain-containing protein [Photobacterium phosphoreum]